MRWKTGAIIIDLKLNKNVLQLKRTTYSNKRINLLVHPNNYHCLFKYTCCEFYDIITYTRVCVLICLYGELY